MAYVYLLRCRDGSLYCGWTTDLDARVAAHAAGKGGRYTRSRLPVELAAAWQTPDRTTARSLEGRIKRRTRRRQAPPGRRRAAGRRRRQAFLILKRRFCL